MKSKMIHEYLISNPHLGYDYETELEKWDATEEDIGHLTDNGRRPLRKCKLQTTLHVIYIEAPYLFDGERSLNIGSVRDCMRALKDIEKMPSKEAWEEVTGNEYPTEAPCPTICVG